MATPKQQISPQLLSGMAKEFREKYDIHYASSQYWFWDKNQWYSDWEIELEVIATRDYKEELSVKQINDLVTIAKRISKDKHICYINKSLDVHFINGIKSYKKDFHNYDPTKKEFFPNIINDNWVENPEKVEVVDKYFDFISSHRVDVKKYLLAIGWLAHSTFTVPQLTVCLGPGGNGKSSYGTLLRKCVGKRNTGIFKFAKLGSDFGWSAFLNKTLMLSPEMEKSQINADEFKQAVGDDLCSINQKFKDPISVELTGTVIQFANQPPNMKDSSNGVGRRLVLIELTAPVYLYDAEGRAHLNPEALTSKEMAELESPKAITYLRKLMYDAFVELYDSNLRQIKEPLNAIINKQNFELETDEVYAWLQQSRWLEDNIEKSEDNEFKIYPQLVYDAFKEQYKLQNDGSDKGLNFKPLGLWKEVKNLIKARYATTINVADGLFRLGETQSQTAGRQVTRGLVLTFKKLALSKEQLLSSKTNQRKLLVDKIAQLKTQLTNLDEELTILHKEVNGKEVG